MSSQPSLTGWLFFQVLSFLPDPSHALFLLFPRYLVPCNHVMLSQKPAVRDVDLYGRAADKFLSLIPRCCRHRAPSPPRPEHASWARGGTSREAGRREDLMGMA